MVGQQIWHCPSELDRKLADMLVGNLPSHVWQQLGQHFGKGYPHTQADKYDLVYRLLGCKKEERGIA